MLKNSIKFKQIKNKRLGWENVSNGFFVTKLFFDKPGAF